MTGTIIHIPTGRLIHENEGSAGDDVKTRSEKPHVLNIVAPDGRSIFSIQKLIEEMENHDGPEQVAA